MSFKWVILIIPLAAFPMCLSRLEEDASLNSTADNTTVDHCVINHCFHKSAEFCPSPDSICRCHQLPNCKKAVVCCNVNSFQLVEGLSCASVSDGAVEALHIQNATLDVLNVSQPTWRRLKYMTVTDGHIKNITGEFSKLTLISCLNLSHNSISKFDERSLVNLYNLSHLDLSVNNLSEVPRFKKEGPVTLDISFNPNMLCSSVLEALNRSELYFSKENETQCSSQKKIFDWSNYTMEYLPLRQIKSLHELSKDCNKMKHNCTCTSSRIEWKTDGISTNAVDVDCSNRGLNELPTPLPPNTVVLNITNNNITSLEVINTPSYEHLRYLYADNNKITSVLVLEDSQFINNFISLSLRNNKINSLPIYIFANAFDRNDYLRTVRLGKNCIHCNCDVATNLKGWLITKSRQIADYKEIFCDNIDSTVMDLDSATLCQSPSDWTDYVYYIITFQVLLLVGLIAKVFYDYWVFKTAGYLPWPASKMPKMPCDWFCE